MVEPGDSEEAIAREAGFSPLVDPLSGLRWGEPGFEPGWDWLSRRGDHWRLVFTMGSTHSTIISAPDRDGVGKVLGHASYQSTQRYSHLAADTLLAAVEAGAAKQAAQA